MNGSWWIPLHELSRLLFELIDVHFELRNIRNLFLSIINLFKVIFFSHLRFNDPLGDYLLQDFNFLVRSL